VNHSFLIDPQAGIFSHRFYDQGEGEIPFDFFRTSHEPPARCCEPSLDEKLFGEGFVCGLGKGIPVCASEAISHGRARTGQLQKPAFDTFTG
jgi:hypothetical protein